MRSQETIKFGELAVNLFGVQSPQIKEPKAIALPPDNSIKAIYPAIIEEAYSQTMDNYRKYVSDYNFRTLEENELIDKHNSKVKLLYKSETFNTLSKEHQIFIQFFPKRYKDLSNREYNTEIDKQPESLSKLLLKRRIQTIKYPTEQIFQNMLHLYNTQLMKRNSEYMRLGVKTIRPIQELDVNSFFITQLKRNNVHSIDVCGKTIRNHRQRLEEAGIFSKSTFFGHTRGVKVEINPEILVVLDLQTNKIATTENQHVTPNGEKKLPDNNDTTGTNKDKYKKSKDASHSFDDKVFPAVTTSLHYKTVFYRNTGSNVENSPVGGAADNVKKEKTLSDKLRERTIHRQELALGLASGEFNNYIPIDIRILQKEAYAGTLTNEEYIETVIQDIFKTATKLYRDANIYPGCWKNALNHWMQNKFRTYNGLPFNKANVFDSIQEIRWRLEHARKWFLRTGVTPLYPSNYFDTTRKTNKEVGFEYTKKAWQRHLQYMESEPVKKRQLERKAALRLTDINHSKKFESQIKRFLKNKITLPELIDYVENNLPAQFYAKLPETLKKLELTFKP
ncbi:hypothetical protein FUA48_08510 [Flavobacterium alkalisoli]|uniref:Uncharacterized protein n=1 Tax=Flavobacterium alkalisoli TaxID=2602769 RepID=A0A5B9FXT1_9FLAO|nr:hypothetical protein [Flavobacterium alkalisoli]QEE49622.1 hypothetical protein FUA48_08510 [Flavobacterium alkalisoli]